MNTSSGENRIKQIILDARKIPDLHKKQYFFKSFDNLKNEEEIIIINSHDISPLKKLFQRERNGLFTWKYLQKGPEVWKVSITKKLDEHFTVEEIININPSAVYILSGYGIDFYTNLEAPVKNLFLNKRENYQEFIDQCLQYKSDVFKAVKPELWSTEFIIQYIIENHHQYLHIKLPGLQKLMDHLELHFSNEYPHLSILKPRFTQFVEEITDHLTDEENMIFPSFLQILKKDKITKNDHNNIKGQINWIIEDHYLAGDNLQSLRRTCNNYRVKEEDIPGLKLLYDELIDLENDFTLHVLFENHILVKAIYRDILS